jgi:hypothetical protein
MTYKRSELVYLDTIEQAWDGDELKIEDEGLRVWLTSKENRPWNGDYTVETYNEETGCWEQTNKYF